MPKLIYNDNAIEISGGDTILSALRQTASPAFFHLAERLSAPCGGHGTCGKCRIGVDSRMGELSPVTPEEAKFLPAPHESALPAGYVWRLACRCRVLSGEIKLWLPTEGDRLSGVQAQQTDTADTTPWIRWFPLALPRPTLENPLSVEEMIRHASPLPLQLTAKASNELTHHLTARMEKEPREKDVTLYFAGVDATSQEPNPDFPITAVSDTPTRPLYGAAVDLGTTTIALSLWRADGKKVAGVVFPNPTRMYGADVISRISYTMEHPEGTEKLKNILHTAIADAIEQLAHEAAISPKDIACTILAGNSVMEHLYAGLDPAPIGKAPFYTQSKFGRMLTADPFCYLAPAAASYVGGDVLMGAAWALWADQSRKNKTLLFLDLGTNGEMGIWKNGKFTFAATAAGPAFEGAHITLGMPAVSGAVRAIDTDTDSFILETIGDSTPTGLCGSAILDGVWQMRRLGLMDEYGGLTEDRAEWKICLPDSLGVDEDGEKCFFSPEIYLTQGDIRQIQTAKSAVAAGIEVLCLHAGISVDEIEEVCLAGSFGHGLRPDAASGIGLIPSVLRERVTPVGNTSEAGCAAFWLHESFRQILADVQTHASYLELSVHPAFGELYMENMLF